MTKRDAQTNDARPEMSCPHCDGEELELFSGEYEPGDPFWYVACLECGAEGPHGGNPEDACKLWDAKHGRHRGACLEFQVAEILRHYGLVEVRTVKEWLGDAPKAA